MTGGIGRRDARRNRAAIVAAAAELLRRHGLDAPLDEVARLAAVGNATLYRHFPTRDDLYEAVFAEAAQEFRELGEHALTVKDGWTALIGYIERMCRSTAADPQMHLVLERRRPASSVIAEIRQHADSVLATLLARAQEQGTVRREVVLTDLLLLILGIQRIVAVCAAVDSSAWRRQATLMLAGLRVECGHDQIVGAPFPAEALAGAVLTSTQRRS